MKVVFMGTPDFAVPTLDALVDAGHDIVCVVAQPDRPSGRGKKLQSPPTIERARALGIPTRQPKAVRSGPFVDWFTQEMEADIGVVVAYGRILIPALLRAPRLGCLNVHASLLPRFRGAAPIQWSLIEGDSETGVCIMQMDEGLDTGDVLLRRSTPIGPDETGPALWQRLSLIGAEAAVDALARLDSLEPVPQDHAQATFAPMLQKSDGLLDFGQSARAVHNRVRGVDPWPGGQCGFRGETLRVLQTRVCEDDAADAPPGTIVEAGARLIVACGEGCLEVLNGQLPGKPRRTGRDLVNGARIAVGELLTGVNAVETK